MAEPTERVRNWLGFLARNVGRSQGAQPSAPHMAPGHTWEPGKRALLPHRAGSAVSEAKARPPAPSLRKVYQPPRPFLPPGAKPTPLPHTQTLPSARRPHHTTSAAAGSCALTPPSPRCPFCARWWHAAMAAAAVAEEKRLRFPSRPGRAAAAAATRGGGHEPQGSGSRPPEGQRGRPPLPRWRHLPLPPHPARGAGVGGAFPPRRALCPAGRARRQGRGWDLHCSALSPSGVRFGSCAGLSEGVPTELRWGLSLVKKLKKVSQTRVVYLTWICNFRPACIK